MRKEFGHKRYTPVILRKRNPSSTERKYREKIEYLRLALTEAMIGFATLDELSRSSNRTRRVPDEDMQLVEATAHEYLKKVEDVLACD